MIETELAAMLVEASVLEVDGAQARLELPDEVCRARIALAFPGLVQPGDRVLAVKQGESAYVIGVLERRGGAVIAAPGDLTITAGGTIRLTGAQGVRVAGEEVSVTASRWLVSAGRAMERFGDALRWVKGLLHVRTGSASTDCQGEHRVTCERNVQRSRRDTRFRGSTIHLG